MYPFSKEAMDTPGRFVLYELAYVAFYYVAWEFAFRGVVLFSLLAFLPRTIPGVAVAILVQTFLSTIYHIGHPHSEVVGAFILGIVAGAATVVTGSILYGFLYHALAGVLNDSLAYRRLARARRSGSAAV
jgi:membrane protease YdiL (CAAX protease family)